MPVDPAHVTASDVCPECNERWYEVHTTDHNGFQHVIESVAAMNDRNGRS
jgi:hypothetical protein